MTTLNNSNQQTLADSKSNERPPMLERGNYIPYESRFRRPMIPDPDGAENINSIVKQILEPLSKMTEGNKKQYIADVKVMNYLLQAIPNEYTIQWMHETMEELTAVVMLMAQIQPADGNAETVPSYDAKAVSEVNASSKVYEQMRHEKRKTIIQTFDDDQIDSNIIFDDLYVENNSGTSDHDSNDHDEYHKIQMLAYDVQREAKNKKRLNNELKKQKMLLQKELETFKKAFKDRENRYLEDICDLEEKPSSHDRIVYKMGQSIQTIHMLGKTPNKVYDPFLKAGLGYKNPERLKKAIAAQPKMYDGKKLYSVNLKIDSPD
ncbi:hypothetical protein Tco_1192831 [Tanacetum coccineum]